MLNKKSIELSLNFIVVILISLVMLGFGIKFISDLYTKANEFEKLSLENIDKKIGNIVCGSSERVCIGMEKKTIQRGSYDIFSIKILNILDSQEFLTNVYATEPIGYKNDATPIPPNVPLIINPESRVDRIKKNEGKNIGIAIQVPKEAVSGTYIFNVEIETEIDEQVKPYSSVQKLLVEVP